jgi:predicted ester cyclase
MGDALEANKELVRRLYRLRLDPRGIEMIRNTFPDFHVEVVDRIAEGDRVASFLRMSGTNTGDYRRGGATGKSGTMRAFFIWRVEDGRLAERMPKREERGGQL